MVTSPRHPRIAVFNYGTTALRFASYRRAPNDSLRCEVRGSLELAEDGAFDAVKRAREVMEEEGSAHGFDLVGHRIVHGGDGLRSPTLIEPWVVEEIERWSVLAPLHNPGSLAVLEAAQSVFPSAAQVAVFDTAFHSTIPMAAARYAVPEGMSRRPLRKFGFHGISCAGSLHAVARHLRCQASTLNLIVCHLGAGASVTAVRDGRSIDTSMGASPTQGLVMATRSGDIDIGVVDMVMREKNRDFPSVFEDLTTRSGLLGLCGMADMEQIRRHARSGSRAARLALDVYAHRLIHYIGASIAQLPELDGLVFTGGVGEHDAALRSDVLDPLNHLGLAVDQVRNHRAIEVRPGQVREIGRAHRTPQVFVVGADEERLIAQDAIAFWQ
jgi:acetate kinase